MFIFSLYQYETPELPLRSGTWTFDKGWVHESSMKLSNYTSSYYSVHINVLDKVPFNIPRIIISQNQLWTYLREYGHPKLIVYYWYY